MTTKSSGSSGHPSTAIPSRSVRSSRWKECEGAFAIDPAFTEAHRAIEVIWRIESARLIAGLARVVGDIGTAEELAQDALVAALEQWPAAGVPERPGAWLMGPGRPRAHGAPRLRPRGDLSDLQRGLFRNGGRGLGPTGALRRGAPSGPHPGRTRPERAGGPRAPRAYGDTGVASAGSCRTVRGA